ncbi:3-hydroxyisobutyrate dehydrogenase-like beta-hydroxyacid dehydrogenase [Constrictibacter sp. MBR-5]|jgi:3-hydroxyisobutyrate dehydrogenase-like beta-hydroxyacid dehydrogenase|uniref:NAD(P)-dependent oxidoreductase n=1 Tax=Constrictibacter sp. MBR-5 TaxID=3156467 RepID=UPI00339A1EAB
MTNEIGFIGVGAMGGPMVRRLCERQYRVRVYDSSQAALERAVGYGAEAAPSPADVAANAETVLVSLPTPAIVREVALGRNGLIEGGGMRTFVDLSTTGPTVAREVAAALAAKGVTAIDAPVSGGIAGAEAGTLAVMVSGPADAIDKARSALEAIGRVFVVGDQVGLGQVLKLVNNGLAATAVVASAEAVAMAVHAGLDAKMVVDVINASSGRNFMTEKMFTERVLTRTFDFGFRTELMHKDIRLCTDEAEAAGVPMFVTSAARQMWSFAVGQGSGREDISTYVRYLEAWTGIEMRSDPERKGPAAAPGERSEE